MSHDFTSDEEEEVAKMYLTHYFLFYFDELYKVST